MDTKRAYEAAKRSYELAVRLQDQALERLLAPPTAGITSRTPLLKALIEQIAMVMKTQEQLATLWTSFRAERLALYRDLGTLPYDDWQSFYADFSTGTVAAHAVPAVPPDQPLATPRFRLFLRLLQHRFRQLLRLLQDHRYEPADGHSACDDMSATQSAIGVLQA